MIICEETLGERKVDLFGQVVDSSEEEEDMTLRIFPWDTPLMMGGMLVLYLY